jgi:hypothetical protein
MLGSGNSTTSVLAVQPPPQVDAPRRQARGAFDFLFRPIAPKAWNALLYCCGGAAAACVGAYLLVPSVSELAVFASLMFFTSGPFSTFLPAASEPILVAFGKLHPRPRRVGQLPGVRGGAPRPAAEVGAGRSSDALGHDMFQRAAVLDGRLLRLHPLSVLDGPHLRCGRALPARSVHPGDGARAFPPHLADCPRRLGLPS